MIGAPQIVGRRAGGQLAERVAVGVVEEHRAVRVPNSDRCREAAGDQLLVLVVYGNEDVDAQPRGAGRGAGRSMRL